MLTFRELTIEQKLAIKNDVPIIHCAVCNKPVEKIEWQDDIASLERERIFRVSCHGEHEVTRLSEELMSESRIEGGVAFTTKRIS